MTEQQESFLGKIKAGESPCDIKEVTDDIFEKWCKEDSSFFSQYQEVRNNIRVNLVRIIYKAALTGDVSAAIWMLNYLYPEQEVQISLPPNNTFLLR